MFGIVESLSIAVMLCVIALVVSTFAKTVNNNHDLIKAIPLTIISLFCLIGAIILTINAISIIVDSNSFDDTYKITSEINATIIDKYEVCILEDKFIFDVAYNKKVLSVEVSRWDYENHDIGDNITLDGNIVYVNLER